MDIANFPINVRSQMDKKGLSIMALAKETGLNYRTIHFIINGQSRANLITAVKIAEALGVSVNYLLKEPGQ